jgi:hypothetical protein
MFLLDDILLSPIKGLAMICQKVHEAAQEDLQQQEKAVLDQIAELYQQFETAGIDEVTFGSRENALLDRLDALREGRGLPGEGP